MIYGSREWLDGTIARQRATLTRVVARLFFMAGLVESRAEMLPRHIWRQILRVRYPAESATRRLIASAARDIAVKLFIRQGKRKPAPVIKPANVPDDADVSAGPPPTARPADRRNPEGMRRVRALCEAGPWQRAKRSLRPGQKTASRAGQSAFRSARARSSSTHRWVARSPRNTASAASRRSSPATTSNLR